MRIDTKTGQMPEGGGRSDIIAGGVPAGRPATLHYFNPWHDEALAAGSPHYQPPRVTLRLEATWACLPMWWARPGDMVCIDSGTERLLEKTSRLTELTSRLIGLTGRRPVWTGKTNGGGNGLVEGATLPFVSPDVAFFRAGAGIPLPAAGTVSPWGWDALAATRLAAWGAAPTLLPQAEWLADVRTRSSRHTAVKLLAALRADEPAFVGSSVWCTSVADVRHAVEAYPHTMLKAPWSGSGRGLRQGHGHLAPPLSGWVDRILARQGAVVVEPFLTRLCDFAAEFERRAEGELEFVGLSLFTTDGTGRYTGNLVAPDESLLRRIGRHVDTSLVLRAIRACQRRLPALLGCYTGPLGIDMMAVRLDDGTAALHPCVEVNVRRTMGRVAVDLRRWLAEGREGRLAMQAARGDRRNPDVRDGRLESGSLPLTPESATTGFGVWLDVCP